MSASADIGTGFLVAGRRGDPNVFNFKSIRDCFLEVENDASTKRMLSMSKFNFIDAGEKLYILGEDACTMANIFKREVRRPLAKGVISPGEQEAEKILLVLLENILGKARVEGETCFYSIPANPIDAEMDVVYHSAMFSKLISSLKYKPISLVEGAAVVFSSAAKEQFSALGISMGAGMVNICLMFKTMIGMAFSLTRSGDWVDHSSARSIGTTDSRICSIKEKGVDLLDPNVGDPRFLREREALSIYYKSLILYTLDSIKKEFLRKQGAGTIEMPNYIPIIISGGTSLAINFKSFFEQAFETIKKDFPIPVSEIRLASSPLNSTAEGLLVAALNYDEGQVSV
jgi:hypothetical protein